MILPRNALAVSAVPVLGVQTRGFRARPPAATSAAPEAIELASSVGLCVSRQNGKSAIVEARLLAGLFLFGEPRIVYSAHEFKTAKEIMRRVERLLIAADSPPGRPSMSSLQPRPFWWIWRRCSRGSRTQPASTTPAVCSCTRSSRAE
jgi:hypothetical protein